MSEAIGSKSVNAFTIGCSDSVFDESEHALKVARHLGIETNLTTFNEADVLSHVREALTVLDEPIADPSVIPTYLVSLVASEKVKVVLTGDGGDELFGGYPKYRIHLWLEIYDRLPRYARRLLAPFMKGLPEKLVGQKGKRVLSTLSYTVEERNMLWISPFLPSELKKLLINEPNFSIVELDALPTGKSGTNPVRIAMKNDLRYALGDLFLSKVDRTSMACSLESRAPFLAPDVLEVASRLPTSDNIGFFKTKKLLKAVALNRLPREIVVRKKRGFGIPISVWLRGPLKEFASSMLSKERIETSSLFHYEKIRQLLDEHFSCEKDNSAKIWTLLVFQVWYDRWLRGTKSG